MTDIEIAESIKPLHITKVAKKLGIKPKELILFGEQKAKITRKISPKKDAKLVLVTAINPTSAGIGKTTVSIGLADALKRLKQSVCLALREPSLGPVFGIKGGATGGGRSQVIPMSDINLHFTGDFHAITSANNLLSAMIDNHIFQGNELDIDTNKVFFKRCLDLNDRALRETTVAEGKWGVARKENFSITSASEIMAIMCLSKDLDDLKNRLGNILVALNTKGKPIYARDFKIADAMAILLKDAMYPNLVQTLEGTPSIIHLGPFANIAHGCNSINATKLSMSLAKYTITEAGFGADLGAQKFFDLKCRIAELKPNAVVLVATIQALKFHGGMDKNNLKDENLEALERGFGNLQRHIEIIKNTYKLPLIVTLNKYTSDSQEELNFVAEKLANLDVKYALNDAWSKGGEGAIEIAKLVMEKCEEDSEFSYSYELEDNIEKKVLDICKNVYGADSVLFTDKAKESLKNIKKLRLDKLPIIIAKTQYSLSDNPKLVGAPKDFEITIRDLEIRSGAGFIVAIAGDIMLMPGLSKNPAGTNMKISSDARISGLF